MQSRNKSRHSSLFDDSLDWSVESAPCYKLMGAIFEQAVVDYKALYRYLQKTAPDRYGYFTKLREFNELKQFFEMYCEDTRFSAAALMRQMEKEATICHNRGFSRNR